MNTDRKTITFDPQVAWVDEYGDSNLDTSIASVSGCFILTAVVLDAGAVDAVRVQVEAVRKRHFQNGEMKSSGVGKNDKRREKVLADLATVPFRFYALVVDKAAIKSDGGLAYRHSFVKFLHWKVYGALYRAFPHLSIVADEYGTKEFMEGFAAYVRKRHIPTLFYQSAAFEHGNSKGEPLLQLADFLSGSLARLFDVKKKTSRPEGLVTLLGQRAISVESWPLDFFGRGDERAPGEGEQDYLIRSYALRTASEFAEKHEDAKDEWLRRQVVAAKHLLFQFTMLDDAAYVQTGKLEAVLAEAGLPVDERLLRANVIGPLRDAGVLVASSPSGGYKIPRGHDELYQYVRMSAGMIGPMLHRIRTAREAVLRVTKGSTDLLGSPDHDYIRSLLDRMPAPESAAQLAFNGE